MATRSARVVWEGDLASGRGTVSATTSAAFRELPVTWAARTGADPERTSPEELLAAAHASCFSMALSAGLARAGTPPSRLEVSAEVAFERGDSGFQVKSSALEVRGSVPGATAEQFARAAEEAKEKCPVSQALKGNVALSVRATLEG